MALESVSVRNSIDLGLDFDALFSVPPSSPSVGYPRSRRRSARHAPCRKRGRHSVGRSCSIRYGSVWERNRPDPQSRPPGLPGCSLRPGVRELSDVHALPSVDSHGPISARYRRNPAADATFGYHAHGCRISSPTRVRDGGHRQDALQQQSNARLFRARNPWRLSGAPRGGSASLPTGRYRDPSRVASLLGAVPAAEAE